MDELIQTIAQLESRIEQLEREMIIQKITIPTKGYLIVDTQTADPATPSGCRLYYNSTLGAMRVYVNGGWHSVNVT